MPTLCKSDGHKPGRSEWWNFSGLGFWENRRRGKFFASGEKRKGFNSVELVKKFGAGKGI